MVEHRITQKRGRFGLKVSRNTLSLDSGISNKHLLQSLYTFRADCEALQHLIRRPHTPCSILKDEDSPINAQINTHNFVMLRYSDSSEIHNLIAQADWCH